jgi:hypothetical protein
MTELVLPFRFHPAFRLPAAAFGIRPDTTWIRAEDDLLEVRFGPWRVRTPLGNVVGATTTGSYAWPKVIGPPHLSLRDRGLTFATNPTAGVCISFDRPVPGMDPMGLLRHPTLTVTPEDAPALSELLDRSSHDPSRTHAPEAAITVEELVEEEADEIASLTAAELRRRARDRGISGTSKMNKSELVQALDPVRRSLS